MSPSGRRTVPPDTPDTPVTGESGTLIYVSIFFVLLAVCGGVYGLRRRRRSPGTAK